MDYVTKQVMEHLNHCEMCCITWIMMLFIIWIWRRHCKQSFMLVNGEQIK